MRSLLLLSDIVDFRDGSVARTALGSGATIVVVDLALPRDSDVLEAACAFIRQASSVSDRPRLYARVPALDDPMAIDVLGAAIGSGAEGIVLPGAVGGHDATRLDARISVEEAVYGIDHGSVKIIAEAAGSARAAMALGSFRGASHRLTGLIWSEERLATDLGIGALTPEGALRAPLAWARGHFLIAAAASGVTAIVDTTVDRSGTTIHSRLAAARDDGFGAGLTNDQSSIADIHEIMPVAKC